MGMGMGGERERKGNKTKREFETLPLMGLQVRVPDTTCFPELDKFDTLLTYLRFWTPSWTPYEPAE